MRLIGGVLSSAVRRLAKQTRNDRVRSTRDYQAIQQRQGAAFRLNAGRPCRLVFAALVERLGNVGFIGGGGYIRTDSSAKLKVRLVTPDGKGKTVDVSSATAWRRFGLAAPGTRTGITRLEIEIPRGPQRIEFWGLDCGAVDIPEEAVARFSEEDDPLNSPQLSPETLYLPQAEAVGVDPVDDEWVGVTVMSEPGAVISVKKCAYCQRYLPLDRKRPSALAFHKHNAKVTGHQNECRACKKWRINDSFNPLRTVDQLHESSVITRERRLFLREPEILARIKDRTGDGLKSIVWKRFGKRCFRCKAPLAIEEVDLDHTRPMAYLWPIDDHATCLCSSCNNHKKERFPIDVYAPDQLKELSSLTGLAYDDLTRREVNATELARLLGNIEVYAREWDHRTFSATARKIREMHPDVDLFAVLRKASSRIHRELLARIAERPDED